MCILLLGVRVGEVLQYLQYCCVQQHLSWCPHSTAPVLRIFPPPSSSLLLPPPSSSPAIPLERMDGSLPHHHRGSVKQLTDGWVSDTNVEPLIGRDLW